MTLNPERLRDVSLDDEELRDEIMRLFLDDAPEQLRVLSAAIEIRDRTAWIGAAHRLGGSSGNIGAEHLSELCRQAERQGRQEGIDGLNSLLGEVGAELEEVQQAFANLQRSGS